MELFNESASINNEITILKSFVERLLVFNDDQCTDMNELTKIIFAINKMINLIFKNKEIIIDSEIIILDFIKKYSECIHNHIQILEKIAQTSIKE